MLPLLALGLLVPRLALALPLGWSGTVDLSDVGRPPGVVRIGIRRVDASGVTIGRWVCPTCPKKFRRVAFRVWCDEYGLPTASVGRSCTLRGLAGSSCFGRLRGYLSCGPQWFSFFGDIDLSTP